MLDLPARGFISPKRDNRSVSTAPGDNVLTEDLRRVIARHRLAQLDQRPWSHNKPRGGRSDAAG
jgi:hypothetical protein